MVPAPIAASIVVPTVMLVGGLAVLVAGLALLVGRRPETPSRVPDDAPSDEPARALAAVTSQTTPDVAPPVRTCDWSAELELPSGKRHLVHPAAREACCRWRFSLSESSIRPHDEHPAEERLYYVGKSTHIGRDGAITPLQRESITRDVRDTPTRVDATLTMVRSAGPSVGSPGWEQLPASDGDPQFDDRARRAWELHLDQLRLQGARPTAGTISDGTGLEHGHRLLLHVQVERGCDADEPPVNVDADARVGWDSRQVGGFDRATAQLSAWVLSDELRAEATTPTAPPEGLTSAAVVGHDPPGVSFACDPTVALTSGAWSGTASARLDKPDFTMDMGVGIQIEAAALNVEESEVTLHGAASCQMTLQVGRRPEQGQSRDVGAVPSCTCATPWIEVVLGLDPVEQERGRTLDSTAVGWMRFDARVVHLRRTAAGAWSVVEDDSQPVQDVEERDGSLDEHRAATVPRTGAGGDRAGDGDRSTGDDRRHHAAR